MKYFFTHVENFFTDFILGYEEFVQKKYPDLLIENFNDIYKNFFPDIQKTLVTYLEEEMDRKGILTEALGIFWEIIKRRGQKDFILTYFEEFNAKMELGHKEMDI